MKKTGISLGWNCNSAIFGINNNLRDTKINGYKTCPFDIMSTNYPGIIECIKDDFKYFCDSDYLKLLKMPDGIPHLTNSEGEPDYLIYNTYYKFLFNHESPGHANLYITEKWSGGINHFTDNNFEKFKERYNKRIQNFRDYLNDENNTIIFILHRYNSNNENISELKNILNEKYPKLNYEFYFYQVNYDRNVIKRDHEIMGFNENDEELKRLL